MNKKTELVFKGFLELSASEESDFFEAMNDYLKKNTKERIELAEVYKSTRLTLGPLSSETCPCCGR